MNNNPIVSVVLPVFNGADFIELALRSLLNQNVNLEIIISDDNSTDNTIDIVKSIKSEKIITLINERKGGQFVNFNRAISKATGKYIQFFSHDDVAHSGFIQSQLDSFKLDDDIGLVYSSCHIIDQFGKRTATTDDNGTPLLIDFLTYLYISSKHGALPPSISSVMVKRAVLEKIGKFDEKFEVAGDLEFFNRVAVYYKFSRNRTLRLDVRIHSGSVTLNPETQLKYMNEEIMILPFYKLYLSEDKYQDMVSERCKTRGADHAKYLLRRLLKLDFKKFIKGFNLLNKINSVPLCIFYAVRQIKWLRR